MNINPVIIFGAQGIGLVAHESFKSNNIVAYGFLDDDPALKGQEVDGLLVMSDTDDDGFLKLIGKKCDAFVAVDDNKLRRSLVTMLLERRQVQPVNALHARAELASTASIGYGNLLAAYAVVNSAATIGSYCLIHPHALIDYQATLGDHVQVGAGAIVGPKAELAEGVFVGAGAIIVAGLNIGKNARIGAGSVVVADVPANTTVFGNPAQKV
jgi:sugar O-acyltransferase (sialic acid O-acetyltransferase NeuD family)